MPSGDGLHFIGGLEFTDEAKGAFIMGYMSAMGEVGAAFLRGCPQPSESAQMRKAVRIMIQGQLKAAEAEWEQLKIIAASGVQLPGQRIRMFTEDDVN